MDIRRADWPNVHPPWDCARRGLKPTASLSDYPARTTGTNNFLCKAALLQAGESARMTVSTAAWSASRSSIEGLLNAGTNRLLMTSALMANRTEQRSQIHILAWRQVAGWCCLFAATVSPMVMGPDDSEPWKLAAAFFLVLGLAFWADQGR